MPLLRFTSTALDNLADIADYMSEASGSASLAERFATRILNKGEELASLPGTMGRDRQELRPGMRSSAFRGYVIFYRY